MSAKTVITVTRQSGCGGSHIAHHLACRLGWLYLDRQILSETARILGLSQNDLRSRDEKLNSLWNSFLEACARADYGNMPSPAGIHPIYPEYPVTDSQIFRSESDFILKAAENGSLVVLGRASSWVLRNHPRHLSIYLHGDFDYRKATVMKTQHLGSDDAEKFLRDRERDRDKYHREFTDTEMYDARHYDLSLNISKMTHLQTENLILQMLEARFPDLSVPT